MQVFTAIDRTKHSTGQTIWLYKMICCHSDGAGLNSQFAIIPYFINSCIGCLSDYICSLHIQEDVLFTTEEQP